MKAASTTLVRKSNAPFAVLARVAGLARRALVAAVPKALAGWGEPAHNTRKISHRPTGGGENPAPVRGVSSLVVWVGVRAGAGLAVLRRSDRRVAEEPRSTLLTQLPLGVVQAALIGEICQVSEFDSGGSWRPVVCLRQPELWTRTRRDCLGFLPCRCQFPGGRSPSGRCTRTARSVPGTNLHLCECIRVHSPGRKTGMKTEMRRTFRTTTAENLRMNELPGRTGPGIRGGIGTAPPPAPGPDRCSWAPPPPC